MTSKQIRQGFLDFFVQKHGHAFVASSPVVPHDDPTLLFTNAGMNQFKPIFLGQEKPAHPRVANTQKCIRAGGKHNDLDDVGRSRRHHTFFEMLGNWSFGDYFKQGAIEMSWELLTKVWKLDPARLHVTCFEGDEANGVPRDIEAADIWKNVANWESHGLRSEDHIHYFGKDNFWEMGDTGPCGPCTEIYIDRRPVDEIKSDLAAGKRSPVNAEDPRVMEIWNNVFIQYNRNPDRSLTELPSQHVDTGMGFERITQVLQDVGSNYDIDLFDGFWLKLESLCGHKYSQKFPPTNTVDAAAEAADESLRKDIAYRVIADHVRCLTFALTDGATISNEGRGYVLRRILRRAARFGRQTLDLHEPFLFSLVDNVVDAMGEAFPEITQSQAKVIAAIQEEEESFGRTLDRGIAMFEEAFFETSRDRQGAVLDAHLAFKLHDTFGFPIDLTQQMAEERGLKVNLAGYELLMDQARDLARAGGKGATSPVYQLPPATLDQLMKQGVPPTADGDKFTSKPIQSTVVGIWNGISLAETTKASDGTLLAVIADQTNFYAEMGGQIGDDGTLESSSAKFEVDTTRQVGGYVLHVGRLQHGTLSVGDKITATVADDRLATQANHTATHILNWALRETLGEGVQQKGSLVTSDRLRFDFSHNKPLSDDELARTEMLINDAIENKWPVDTKTMAQDQALKIHGIRAMFGEKYPPQVRVVAVGALLDDVMKTPADARLHGQSFELCGGTHVGNAGDIGSLHIVEESSVAKGVRRLVAITGNAASEVANARRDLEALLASVSTVSDATIASTVTQIQAALPTDNLPLVLKRRAQQAVRDLQAKQKSLEKAKQQNNVLDIAAIAEALVESVTNHAIVSDIPGASDDQLRSLHDSLRKRLPTLAAMLGAVEGEKITFIATVSDDLIARGLKAGDWVKETAKAAGGGGGGKPNLAQAGGKDVSKLADALEVARTFAAGKLS